jgi:hypothetical protein
MQHSIAHVAQLTQAAQQAAEAVDSAALGVLSSTSSGGSGSSGGTTAHQAGLSSMLTVDELVESLSPRKVVLPSSDAPTEVAQQPNSSSWLRQPRSSSAEPAPRTFVCTRAAWACTRAVCVTTFDLGESLSVVNALAHQVHEHVGSISQVPSTSGCVRSLPCPALDFA